MSLKCSICGKEEDITHWNNETQEQLKHYQMCFNCNFWREQYEEDKKRGEHNYAIVDGDHYVLMSHFNNWPKGFCGHTFKFKFNDGIIKECDNVWFQGDLKDAHPYWRELMPDNAVILK